ncbi:MAG: peptidoglycan-binding domain-containing protein [Phreatobacter sp.]|uniref:peptidoglycan-binding domain-containing protein n=1 Tax=Phreatobacter sp. TaxID=1966341 RepID=UPI0027360606|nr:peptidoglycan-binding domain-containing protein [Phreatobacter sp.]MDP2801352.1 peptidoglycan-binding domain-containing protein [Phreatobacter sp.]
MRDATYDDEDLRPRRGRAAHDMDDEAPRTSLWRQIIGRSPGDRIALVLLGFVAVGIVTNALVRQTGPHPAPLFAAAVIQPAPAPVAARPADVQQTASITPRQSEASAPAVGAAAAAARSRSDIIADVQRELLRRRLYDGTVDGRSGPKTEAAIRRYETEARLTVTGEASESLLARLRRGAPAAASAAAVARPATAPAAPQGPQNIADLLSRDPRAVPAPRPAPAPRERSIGDLIAAESSGARR